MMIEHIEDYFARGCGRCARFDTPDCSTKKWLDGLLALRGILLSCALEEHVKWGHPCYMASGRNIAIIGAFRENYRLSFFNAALMKDPDGVLEKQGPNTEHNDMIRFDETLHPQGSEAIIRAYIKEAIGYAAAGIRPEKSAREIDMPEELTLALDADPELAEAFHALTPGRQKSYYFNLNSARQSATRFARINKFRDKIIAGKGALER